MTKKVIINIIMGFLGVGKTTAILSLLERKPRNERWAVLVNEFGEVGIDGAIISAASGMTVSEVPGGCLCCVSGIPFQVALANLVAQEKPDRILIEPTGLGHPKNLIRNLTAKDYAELTDVKASICLLDPRQLKDPRYQQHDTFNDQCYLADVLVANKTDLCSHADKENFYQFSNTIKPEKNTVGWVEQGVMELAWLDVERNKTRTIKGHNTHYHDHHHGGESNNDNVIPVQLAPDLKYQSFENEGMGYYSLGWLFSEDMPFHYPSFVDFLMSLDVERVKGLVITDQGTRVVNLREQVFTEMPTRALKQSRIEIIDNKKIDKENLEEKILACLC